jgi:glycosyltransferase involved in cell wall biosynthesis
LFLIGEATLKIPTRNDIIYLGYLDEVEKFDLMSAADILIQPSPNESFSITLLESLLCKTPVLVNGKCEVLKGHCMRSNAGLWYENYDEFETCLDLLLSDKKLRMKMGENGKKYVEENYSWPKIGEKYINLLKILSRHTH